MHPIPTRTVSPAALRVLGVTARHWALARAAPGAGTPGAPRHAAQSTPRELRRWPYWPAYPGAAFGWR
ncbi:hypothetical protein [Ottowia beijingensis]|uniref:hypothetical protein n=1 Tax=Ottowia beijingensis TaxID=1207057 RepID=UPI002FDB26E5